MFELRDVAEVVNPFFGIVTKPKPVAAFVSQSHSIGFPAMGA